MAASHRDLRLMIFSALQCVGRCRTGVTGILPEKMCIFTGPQHLCLVRFPSWIPLWVCFQAALRGVGTQPCGARRWTGCSVFLIHTAWKVIQESDSRSVAPGPAFAGNFQNGRASAHRDLTKWRLWGWVRHLYYFFLLCPDFIILQQKSQHRM